MNADTSIDIEDLHDAIAGAISAQFPDILTVEFYREESDRQSISSISLPACLIEMTEMEPSPQDDPGTEQLAVWARFEARLIIGFRTTKAKIEIRKLSAALAVFLRFNRWSLPVGPAEVLAIIPDNFSPELDRFEVWRVEWRQLIHLGESVWVDDGSGQLNPVYSWAPEIGTGHEEYYKPI